MGICDINDAQRATLASKQERKFRKHVSGAHIRLCYGVLSRHYKYTHLVSNNIAESQWFINRTKYLILHHLRAKRTTLKKFTMVANIKKLIQLAML